MCLLYRMLSECVRCEKKAVEKYCVLKTETSDEDDEDDDDDELDAADVTGRLSQPLLAQLGDQLRDCTVGRYNKSEFLLTSIWNLFKTHFRKYNIPESINLRI